MPRTIGGAPRELVAERGVPHIVGQDGRHALIVARQASRKERPAFNVKSDFLTFFSPKFYGKKKYKINVRLVNSSQGILYR